jgi:hypothetical protein
MGLTDTSDDDDIKAGLLTAALSSFSEDVPLYNLSIHAICRALVETRAFMDQKVFKVEDIVIARGRSEPKVHKWIERVMKGDNKKFKMDEKSREVVKVETLGKKGKKK